MEKFYSCDQVAERYGVKIETVWSWIREKKLNAIKVGKLYRITPEQLMEFEQRGNTASATTIPAAAPCSTGTA